MVKLLLLVAALSAILVLGGCIMSMPAQVNGLIFTSDVSSPHAWMDSIDNSVTPAKSGMAEAEGILGFAFGDSSIKTAMEQGGITKIHHVDSKTFNVLGVYAKSTTIVYGE